MLAGLRKNSPPPIPVEDVERALEVLLRLGFIVEDKDGVRRGDASLTTGHEVNSLAIVNYHHQMIERGAESIERIPPGISGYLCIDDVCEAGAGGGIEATGPRLP